MDGAAPIETLLARQVACVKQGVATSSRSLLARVLLRLRRALRGVVRLDGAERRRRALRLGLEAREVALERAAVRGARFVRLLERGAERRQLRLVALVDQLERAHRAAQLVGAALRRARALLELVRLSKQKKSMMSEQKK